MLASERHPHGHIWHGVSAPDPGLRKQGRRGEGLSSNIKGAVDAVEDTASEALRAVLLVADHPTAPSPSGRPSSPRAGRIEEDEGDCCDEWVLLRT